MVWLLDLDGVVWLAGQPIPGAAGAVARLRSAGQEVGFVTNNSHPTVAEHEATLGAHGIDGRGSVLTSAMAAATLMAPGERVMLCAGPGAGEAVAAAGATTVDDGADVDVVLVGLDPAFDYDRLRRASTAVRAGARLVATNDDATFPMPAGLVPGAGAVVAAIERASGVAAVVAGKPYPPMVELVRARYGGTGLIVGDRPDTDGALARALGWRFGLVLTGVTTAAHLPVDPEPALVAPDLAALVDVAS